MSDRDQFTDHTEIVTQPIAWIARRSIQTIGSADHPRSSACNISDPQLNIVSRVIREKCCFLKCIDQFNRMEVDDQIFVVASLNSGTVVSPV